MMTKKLLILLCTFLSIAAMAQERVVTGRVTAKDGQPIPGVNVLVKGTSANGTVTDTDGKYSLTVPEGAVLIFSAVGMKSYEVPVGAKSVVDANLEEDVKQLEEVIVTALGQTKAKAKIGYSTVTFGANDLSKAAPTNMLESIQNKVAGADITSLTGSPGGSMKVVIRGYGVIAGGNNQPLYVIDGVPLSDARLGSRDESRAQPSKTANGETYDYGNGMSYVNPNDIESITILKGTDAAALYGSSARNGAVMITTKKGKPGKLKVDISSSFAISQVGKLPTYQKTFGQGWEGSHLLPENGSWGPKLDGQMRLWGNVVDDSQLNKPFSYVGIRDFWESGKEWNNSVGLSGGNEHHNFYLSYGNLQNDATLPGPVDRLNRNTISLRTGSKFNDLTISTSFNYVNRVVNQPNYSSESGVSASAFEEILQLPVDVPITDLQNYNNKFYNFDNYFTPYAENPYYVLGENGSKQITDRLFANVNMEYKINKIFSSQFRIGTDVSSARSWSWSAMNAPKPGSGNDGANQEHQKKSPDLGSYAEQSDRNMLLNADLIFKASLPIAQKDLTLDALAGLNLYQYSESQQYSKITGLVIPKFYNLSNTKNSPVTTNLATLRRRMGLYGEATLGFKNQLFLTGQFRVDKSSTLPSASNTFSYPGANLAWLPSHTFDLQGTPLSLLKFRVAYGKTGSDPDPYLLYTRLLQGDAVLGFGDITFPFNGVGGYEIENRLGSPNLKPIFTTEFEAGTEMKLFRDRVGIDLTYYHKLTDGQIFESPIAPSTGYAALVSNIGRIRNQGIELAVNMNAVNSPSFRWDIGYVFSNNRNEVVELSGLFKKFILEDAYDAEFVAIKGRPVGTFLAPVPRYTPDGKIVVSPDTGIPLVSETRNEEYESDKGVYGTSQRNFIMGLSNTFTYKDFALAVNLDWKQGGMFYSGVGDLVNFTGNSITTAYNDRKPFLVPNSVNENPDWQNRDKQPYVENRTPVAYDRIDDYYYHTQNKAMSYHSIIVDRSFAKLRNVSLSYSLPKSFISRIRASQASINVFVKNVILWIPKSNVYIDPEASNRGTDLNSEFGEFRTGPTNVTMGCGVNLSF